MSEAELGDAVKRAEQTEPWIVDSAGTVRTPMSWLIPRAKHTFARLVGEDGLARLIRERTKKSEAPKG